MSSKEDFMRRAIELAREGMRRGAGGPFGAVVARDGEILGEGFNQVVATRDPTAHGEVVAIRDACGRVGSFSLEGAEVFTTGQPCPMCLGAIQWARISRIYYGFRIEDSMRIGFDDGRFFDEFARPEDERRLPSGRLLAAEAAGLLDEYLALPDRVGY